ncbi:hypothetical protein ILYODFUR_030264, partial [Ilyodon furcidens]
ILPSCLPLDWISGFLPLVFCLCLPLVRGAALCGLVTASPDSSEDLDQSAIRLQSVGPSLPCLDHFLLWILCLIPRLRSGSWKLTAVLLLSDPEFLNKPFNLSLCVWLNLGSLSLVVIQTCWVYR